MKVAFSGKEPYWPRQDVRGRFYPHQEDRLGGRAAQ